MSSKLIALACRFIGYGLALSFLISCQSTPEIPTRVKYDCSFDASDYFPDAPRLEVEKLTELFTWISKRVKGGLVQGQGWTLSKRIEKDHWGISGYRDEQPVRIIWLVPSELTKNNNPMNIIIDRRGDNYVLTRIDEEHREAFRFRKSWFRLNLGYCDSLPAPKS